VIEKHDTKKFVGVQMPQELNAKLEKIASGECNTVSSVIRRLLVAAIKDEERRDAPQGDAA
jgi:metal-responsive CopG/Arc/MetJ family transcriptional regulator